MEMECGTKKQKEIYPKLTSLYVNLEVYYKGRAKRNYWL